MKFFADPQGIKASVAIVDKHWLTLNHTHAWEWESNSTPAVKLKCGDCSISVFPTSGIPAGHPAVHPCPGVGFPQVLHPSHNWSKHFSTSVKEYSCDKCGVVVWGTHTEDGAAQCPSAGSPHFSHKFSFVKPGQAASSVLKHVGNTGHQVFSCICYVKVCQQCDWTSCDSSVVQSKCLLAYSTADTWEVAKKAKNLTKPEVKDSAVIKHPNSYWLDYPAELSDNALPGAMFSYELKTIKISGHNMAKLGSGHTWLWTGCSTIGDPSSPELQCSSCKVKVFPQNIVSAQHSAALSCLFVGDQFIKDALGVIDTGLEKSPPVMPANETGPFHFGWVHSTHELKVVDGPGPITGLSTYQCLNCSKECSDGAQTEPPLNHPLVAPCLPWLKKEYPLGAPAMPSQLPLYLHASHLWTLSDATSGLPLEELVVECQECGVTMWVNVPPSLTAGSGAAKPCTGADDTADGDDIDEDDIDDDADDDSSVGACGLQGCGCSGDFGDSDASPKKLKPTTDKPLFEIKFKDKLSTNLEKLQVKILQMQETVKKLEEAGPVVPILKSGATSWNGKKPTIEVPAYKRVKVELERVDGQRITRWIFPVLEVALLAVYEEQGLQVISNESVVLEYSCDQYGMVPAMKPCHRGTCCGQVCHLYAGSHFCALSEPKKKPVTMPYTASLNTSVPMPYTTTTFATGGFINKPKTVEKHFTPEQKEFFAKMFAAKKPKK